MYTNTTKSHVTLYQGQKSQMGLSKSWLKCFLSNNIDHYDFICCNVMNCQLLLRMIEYYKVLRTITDLTAHPLSRKWTVTFSIGPNGRNRLQTSSLVVLSDILPMYTIRLSSYMCNLNAISTTVHCKFKGC